MIQTERTPYPIVGFSIFCVDICVRFYLFFYLCVLISYGINSSIQQWPSAQIQTGAVDP